MKTNKKTKLFYLAMSLVCAVMAILILATANENNWGGLALQRTIAVVLGITSVAFSTRLVPPGGK